MFTTIDEVVWNELMDAADAYRGTDSIAGLVTGGIVTTSDTIILPSSGSYDTKWYGTLHITHGNSFSITDDAYVETGRPVTIDIHGMIDAIGAYTINDMHNEFDNTIHMSLNFAV